VEVILDTNALSAAADENPALMAALERAEQVAIPVIVIGEYRYGIAQSRHQRRYQQWLDGLLADCRVLDINERTTHHYAAIHLELKRAGKPIPTNDLWIAALCRQHAMPILSRDRHFDAIHQLRRIEW
jgi:tRNA(fMet)-specific endonuclease VapC